MSNTTTDPKEKAELWSLIEGFDHTIGMLTTRDTIDGESVMRSRPMGSVPDREAGRIRFLTKADDPKVGEVERNGDVAIAYMSTDDNAYVSISGRATVSRDRALIEKVWNVGAEIWFSGDPESADVAVIDVELNEAEYWRQDETGVRRAYEMVKGYLTKDTPDIGKNAKLDLDAA